MSLGGQFNDHMGQTAEEVFINSISGAGKPGIATCISAGNDGAESFHASGKFNSNGQADRGSTVIDLIMKKTATVEGYINMAEDWILAVRGRDNVLVTPEGAPATLFIIKEGAFINTQVDANGGIYYGPVVKSWPADLPFPTNGFELSQQVVRVYKNEGTVTLKLPPGRYELYALGGENVMEGRFDLYIGDSRAGGFGKGNEYQYMVGSPGNARNAITVGSYDFRSNWQNLNGSFTSQNLTLGEKSIYSNPGYCRDGTIKPDIVSPGQYAISSLARNQSGRYCEMARDPRFIAADDQHLAWNGTSASSPFVAGVIALMFQKNPKLDSEQIRKILAQSATVDEQTSGVPNHDWGYGKINPTAALRMTPSAQ